MLEKARLDAKEKRRNIVHPKNLCFKCHAKPTISYRNSLVCCKTCFKDSVIETHFRSVIRSFLDLKANKDGKFLILLSGGPGSLCLAYMASETINQKAVSKRKMFIKAELLYINEEVFYPWDKEFKDENLARLEQFAAAIDLKLNVVDLGQKYKLDYESAADILEANSDRGSCREDTITFLRNSAIEDFAIKNDFHNLVVGDTGLRVVSF